MDERELPIVDQVSRILVQHQRMDSRSCRCGWDELGRSHADHKAKLLQEAGLLKDDPK